MLTDDRMGPNEKGRWQITDDVRRVTQLREAVARRGDPNARLYAAADIMAIVAERSAATGDTVGAKQATRHARRLRTQARESAPTPARSVTLKSCAELPPAALRARDVQLA